MLDLFEIADKVDCFVFGHQFDRSGVCRNCGEDRR